MIDALRCTECPHLLLLYPIIQTGALSSVVSDRLRHDGQTQIIELPSHKHILPSPPPNPSSPYHAANLIITSIMRIDNQIPTISLTFSTLVPLQPNQSKCEDTSAYHYNATLDIEVLRELCIEGMLRRILSVREVEDAALDVSPLLQDGCYLHCADPLPTVSDGQHRLHGWDGRGQ
jgi:hypothetical protein